METRDKILSIMRMRGPIIPANISKELGMDLLFASAHLSELSSKKLVRISNLKIGGTPLYFLPGQEDRLQEYTKYINTKDLETYNLLKQEKVLRDSDLTPLSRVSCKSLKDFAVPLEVNTGSGVEVFWKWYLCSNDEITPIVKGMLGIGVQEVKKEEPVKEEPVREEPKPEPIEEKQVEKQIEEIQRTLSGETSRKTKKIPKVAYDDEEFMNFYEAAEETDDDFMRELGNFFKEKEIDIIDYEVVRKNSELELVLDVPSSIGKLTYFCHARNKKKCNDGDLSSASHKGLKKQLPALLITTGELTKKAEGMLDKDFKGMSAIRI